jgi:signal transduction histidine kinase
MIENVYSLSYSFLIWVLMIGLELPVTDSSNKTRNIFITENTPNTMAIGSKTMIAYEGFSEDFLRKNVKSHLLLKDFTLNDQEEVLFDIRNGVSTNWVVFRVINTRSSVQKYVIYTPHVRCDSIRVFSLKKGKIQSIAGLSRWTPIVERTISSYDFAIPLSFESKDTTLVFLESQRFFGFHGITPYLSSSDNYPQEMLRLNIVKLIEVLLTIVLILVLSFLGYVFKQKPMLYFVIYLVCLLALSLSYFGYLDHYVIQARHSINSSTLSILSLLCCNITVHPFLYHFEPLNSYNLGLYKNVSIVLIFLNLCLLSLFFLPTHSFQNANLFVSTAVTFLTLINMVWIISHAVFVFIEKKKFYLIVLELIILLPAIISSLYNVGQSKPFVIPHLTFLPYIGILAFFVLLIVQLKNNLTLKKNLLIQQNQLNEIRRSEIAGIGRNLHDNVGNLLISAYEFLSLNDPKIDSVKDVILDAVHEIRFVSHNLVNDTSSTLSTKIQSLIERFNSCSSLVFRYEDFTNFKIDKLRLNSKHTIYLILQEIMTNVIKHAKATEVRLQIFDDGDKLQITVEDDGIGMENVSIHKNGIGLKNIRKRAELSSFKIIIDSTTKGTVFIIDIPYEN